MAATTEHHLPIRGLSRSYRLHVPDMAARPADLLIVFHGGGSTASEIERLTRFSALSDAEGFVVVYPEAIAGHWNDGRNARHFASHAEGIDDVGFTRCLIDEADAVHPINRSRVFATGLSNGGILCHRLAAEVSDQIAGIAPVAAGMPPGIAEAFALSHPVSLFVIQGDADPRMPFEGGAVRHRGKRQAGEIIATNAVIQLYRAWNGIPEDSETLNACNHVIFGKEETRIAVYPSGTGGVRLQTAIIRNGGHVWPGPTSSVPTGDLDCDFDASQTIWRFFRTCPGRSFA